MKFSAGAVSLLLLASACRGSEPGQTATTKQEPVVARVGDGSITAREFSARLEEQPPFIRARYTTVERKKEFLENLVRVELLAQEARRQGLDKDPDVLATLEKLMVQRLVQKHAATLEKQPVSEEDVRTYYREHSSDFMSPERVRISHVFLAAAPQDARRAQVKQEAARLLTEQSRGQPGASGASFAELVRKRSDDAATKTQEGDLGLKAREELTTLWGPEFAQAAFSLETKDAVAQVETERGIHLIKLIHREPGNTQSFEVARPRIEARLQMERRSRAIDDLIANLKKSTPIEIDDKVLEQASAEGAAPAQQEANPARK
ncbi:foldase protein PrsA [Cystobacter ferrugineus]|uniref:PpiC domain-containing protein n=1 Tax=Cystobacter ferrugineus TaxID=83449 RepID=A0A1L9BC61_9BACT|nr:peptidyl-prolyl cis-trans isomerase [Cystobacter ferrugineus]OJH39803.1 hypothetical protein BON30_19665 [Cystobacter ferrugineus]